MRGIPVYRPRTRAKPIPLHAHRQGRVARPASVVPVVVISACGLLCLAFLPLEVLLGTAEGQLREIGSLTFALERRRGVPLFQQIARAVTKDIRRRRLRPGDRLPGTRTLARLMGWFYLFTGVWPLLHRRSFERVTGPHARS